LRGEREGKRERERAHFAALGTPVLEKRHRLYLAKYIIYISKLLKGHILLESRSGHTKA
jgi:hypothetical protein